MRMRYALYPTSTGPWRSLFLASCPCRLEHQLGSDSLMVMTWPLVKVCGKSTSYAPHHCDPCQRHRTVCTPHLLLHVPRPRSPVQCLGLHLDNPWHLPGGSFHEESMKQWITSGFWIFGINMVRLLSLWHTIHLRQGLTTHNTSNTTNATLCQPLDCFLLEQCLSHKHKHFGLPYSIILHQWKGTFRLLGTFLVHTHMAALHKYIQTNMWTLTKISLLLTQPCSSSFDNCIALLSDLCAHPNLG